MRARDVVSRGVGVLVCVVDTGVDSSHPDPRGQVAGAYGTPGVKYKSSDDSGHGTHVSGVAALMLSSGQNLLHGRDIGLPSYKQGQGLIDASLSAN